MNAIAGFSLASLAIRSCFVDTLAGFKAPSCFSKATLLQRRSASLGRVRPSSVPRRPQYYQSAKTPRDEHGVAYVFASPPPFLLSLRSLPVGGEFRPGPAPFSATAPSAFWKWVAHRDSQVPGESIPYLCPALRFRPVRQVSPWRPCPVRSPPIRQRGHQRCLFRNSITRLRYPLPTLQVVRCRTRMQGSLPAGGWPLPGGSRTHWIPSKGFRYLHSFPPSQAYPGATDFQSGEGDSRGLHFRCLPASDIPASCADGQRQRSAPRKNSADRSEWLRRGIRMDSSPVKPGRRSLYPCVKSWGYLCAASV